MVRKLAEYFSRKFVLSLASLVGSFFVVWWDKDILGWATAIGVVLAFYNGSNVLQNYVDIKREANQPKPEA